MNCNHCLTPVDGFEIETDDPNVGWCSVDCWEQENEEPYYLRREL